MAEPQIVYVDDSGTDGKSKVAAAAFCVSTVDRWQELLEKWNKIADHAGFELRNFHTTEFAACRRDHLCQQCQAGASTVQDHPWQKWSEAKRENVLNRMAKALVKYVEWGVGHSYAKADFDEHVRNSPAKAVSMSQLQRSMSPLQFNVAEGVLPNGERPIPEVTVLSLYSITHPQERNAI